MSRNGSAMKWADREVGVGRSDNDPIAWQSVLTERLYCLEVAK